MLVFVSEDGGRAARATPRSRRKTYCAPGHHCKRGHVTPLKNQVLVLIRIIQVYQVNSDAEQSGGDAEPAAGSGAGTGADAETEAEAEADGDGGAEEGGGGDWV